MPGGGDGGVEWLASTTFAQRRSVIIGVMAVALIASLLLTQTGVPFASLAAVAGGGGMAGSAGPLTTVELDESLLVTEAPLSAAAVVGTEPPLRPTDRPVIPEPTTAPANPPTGAPTAVTPESTTPTLPPAGTSAPVDLPSAAPSASPSDAPTAPPSTPPTDVPTAPPTTPPSTPPTQPPGCARWRTAGAWTLTRRGLR